jgi:hypothetical protein
MSNNCNCTVRSPQADSWHCPVHGEMRRSKLIATLTAERDEAIKSLSIIAQSIGVSADTTDLAHATCEAVGELLESADKVKRERDELAKRVGIELEDG